MTRGAACVSGLLFAISRLLMLPMKLLVISVGVGEGVLAAVARHSISLKSLRSVRLVDGGRSSFVGTLVMQLQAGQIIFTSPP